MSNLARRHPPFKRTSFGHPIRWTISRRCAHRFLPQPRRAHKLTVMRRWLILIATAFAFAPAAEQAPKPVDSAGVKWRNVEIPGVPKGMLQKVLYENPANKNISAIIRFPKGFRDPRHFHTTCGHSLYILKGKLESPDGVIAPGMYVYSPRNLNHGPFTALEETDMLLFTDGPLDYHVAEKQ
jgi:quercetin dioxygenase-like cupin family protein